MASDCKTVIGNIDIQVQNDIGSFENDVLKSVANLNGHTSKSGINNAKARLENALTSKE